MKNDVIDAVLKALELADEVNASQLHFLQILQYGKELYCKGDSGFENLWPRSWQSAMKMLEDQGYKDPLDYFVCLSNDHPCSYNILSSINATCNLCGQSASSCIKYSYLPLKNKIEQWCRSSTFCRKMTAHWTEKDHWLNSTQDGHTIRRELWDGSCFNELSWFWNPHCEWTLPVCCPFCKTVISAITVDEVVSRCSSNSIELQCSECHTRFDHEKQKATGDPRNIALIGHWDGWQPFSITGKHSSGM